MTRSARLLNLIQALRRRRRAAPASDLAAELGVSLRTIYRDIATLVGQGAPIEGEAGVGYVLRPGYLLPPLMFDPDELDALILGLRLAASRGDETLEVAADNALAKIVAVLPQAAEDEVAGSALLAGPSPAGSSQLATLRRAMRSERKLRLRYADKAGSATQRIVWPVAIGFFEAAEVLAAWCELRRDFRHFRLDRIRSAEILADGMPKRRSVLLADWRVQRDDDAY